MMINLLRKRDQNLSACPTSWRRNSRHRYMERRYYVTVVLCVTAR